MLCSLFSEQYNLSEHTCQVDFAFQAVSTPYTSFTGHSIFLFGRDGRAGIWTSIISHAIVKHSKS
jgi:hypothetical protein